jgi:hypothetical protein
VLHLLFAFVLSASASVWQSQNEAIYDVHAHKFIPLSELPSVPGEIFVFGEEHAPPPQIFMFNEKPRTILLTNIKGGTDPATYIHHNNQLRLIQHLSAAHSVSVGMEFLTYTLQNIVDQFLAGVLPETDFLKQVEWGKNPFEYYRAQILAPKTTGGRTIALNIPSDVASQVAKGGKDSLSPAQMALTPPLWERGNDAYFERFAETMQGHAPPDAIDRYFWAQSLWDDTMAWQAAEHRRSPPNDVMVIIVGEFHVQYGGGLPSELKKQTSAEVKTVLQIETSDWLPATLQAAIAADPKYGDAADYLWLHNGITEDANF